VAVPLAYCISIPAVLRFIGVRARELVAGCGPPAISAGFMYAAVIALRPKLAAWPAEWSLLALSLGGALVYLSVIALVSRRHLSSARSFARTLLGRDAPDPA
jgi:hypothetical protein